MDRPAIAADIFESLVQEHWHHVFALAYQVIRHYQDAEDQTQEVFLKAYRSISSLRNPHALPAWLAKITLNTCCDALAYRRRRLLTMPFELSDQLGITEYGVAGPYLPTPEQAAERAERHRSIVIVLRQLDQSSRHTLMLRDVEGRSYQEIGQLLQLGPSAVKMRIHRARQLFSRLLDDVDPDLRRARRSSRVRDSSLGTPE
jgi:RNA polymerase sigma-70 factor (ECF subfamily)